MNDLSMMPPEAPRAMPQQDFARAYRDVLAPAEPAAQGLVGLWRVLAFVPALGITAWLAFIMVGWFSDGGISGSGPDEARRMCVRCTSSGTPVRRRILHAAGALRTGSG